MGAVFTPVFYIFSIAAAASAVIVCGFEWTAVITAVFLILLAACAASDINKGIVPDLIVIFIAVIAIVKILINGISIQNIISHLAGALVLSVPMLIAALIVRNGFGGGDIKMMAAAGLVFCRRILFRFSFVNKKEGRQEQSQIGAIFGSRMCIFRAFRGVFHPVIRVIFAMIPFTNRLQTREFAVLG